MYKHKVISTRFNKAKDEMEEYIAGEFSHYLNADIFKKAYKEVFTKSEPYIVTERIG